MAADRQIKVLFVCTGNICRSPTAEGVFRHLAVQAGIAPLFHIDSAGTDSYHVGEAPDRRAIKIAAGHGVSLQGQRARALSRADFNDFNYLYAMDRGHLSALQSRAPAGHHGQIALFLSAAGLPAQDVPDPWYGDEAGFEHVFALVHDASVSLLSAIRKAHGI